MLVLTRRENEKVLFPALGISVEVIRLTSKKAQLGIDAPRSIRVIREELHGRSFDEPVPNFSANEIQEDLDSASMAIHLAQNQLRQGREIQAEIALDNALACLKIIEEKLSFNEENDRCFVREHRPAYELPGVNVKRVVEQWRNGFVGIASTLTRHRFH